jgi:alpha-beta hydrolase superfamily lysophospholipase
LVQLAGGPIRITVHRPGAADPAGTLIWLQHGFGRSAQHLRALACALAEAGHLVIVPDLPSAMLPIRLPAPLRLTAGQRGRTVNNVTGNRPFLDEIAELLLTAHGDGFAALELDPARGIPGRLVMVGHSAGADAVSWVAGQLALAGHPPAVLVLLDPVPSPHGDNLAAGARLAQGVPVRIVSAAPGRCNRHGLGTRLVLAARPDALGVELLTGCHGDAEGVSSDLVARLLCGVPAPANVAALTALVRGWVTDSEASGPPELSALLKAGGARPIGLWR